MAVTIRIATSNDIPSVMELVKKVVIELNANGNFQWNSEYPSSEIYQQDLKLQELWVAVVNGQIVGVTATTTNQEPEYADVGWDIQEEAIVTHRMAVDSSCRGQGIGTKLMEQAEKEAIRRGIKLLRVDTNKLNVTMQNLLPKLGYVFAGEISLKVSPGRFSCYEKKLE